MPSERVQRQIARYLDAAEAAADRLDWTEVRDRATAARSLDRENADALTFLAAAERDLADYQRMGMPLYVQDAQTLCNGLRG